MTHPYSIYVWVPVRGEGHWSEPARCLTEQDALYIANLMHRDSKAVIKVVRYGINLQCFPDAHAVELVEKQIAKQREPFQVEEPDITFIDE